VRAIKTIIISILAIGLLAGSAVGVAAQSAAVTGGFGFGDDCEPQPVVTSCTGGRFEFDDDRLTGDYEMTETIATGFPPGGFGEIITEEFRVTNDEGAWSGQAIYGTYFPDDGEQVVSGDNRVLTGEDAYEGLTAWLYTPFNGGTTQGIIIDSESME
jgi:hypothetical protein